MFKAITNRHNSVKDITTNLLREVTNNVQIEPTFEPKSGEVFSNPTNSTENGRVDMAAQRVWIRIQRAYLKTYVRHKSTSYFSWAYLQRSFTMESLQKKMKRERSKFTTYAPCRLSIDHLPH